MPRDLANDAATSTTFLGVFAPGLVGAAVIPLFLSIGGNDLFEKTLRGEAGYIYNLFLIFGFCALAGLSAPSFVESMAAKALATEAKKEAKEAKDDAEKAKEGAEDAKDETKELKANLPESPASAQTKNFSLILKSAGNRAEKQVLQAFANSGYSLRTVRGLSRDSGLRDADLERTIAALVDKELLKSVTTKRGEVMYQINPKK